MNPTTLVTDNWVVHPLVDGMLLAYSRRDGTTLFCRTEQLAAVMATVAEWPAA